MYVIGDVPCIVAPIWYRHSSFPVRESSASRLPSASPLKINPEAVDSKPAVDGDRYSNCQRRSPVTGSIARSAPMAFVSDPATRCAAPPVNRSPSLYSGFHA